jgi:hypothetical protein
MPLYRQLLAATYGYIPALRQRVIHAEYAQDQLLGKQRRLQVGGGSDPVHLFA